MTIQFLERGEVWSMQLREVSTDDFYPHQQEYYDALCKMKEEKENFHSIVCIPTGGGKTRLAITYAINKELNEGKRILWIAHSHYLLDQAYDAFREISNGELSWENMLMIYYLKDGELSVNNELFVDGKETIDVRNVRDFSFAWYERYDVIVASFQSILNYVKLHENLGEKNPLEKLLGSNVCIIVDEVHHLGAPTYYDLLANYVKDKTLIGLSATPVRRNTGDYRLGKIFLDDLGVAVNMADLIAKGCLAKPVFEEVYINRNEETLNRCSGESIYNNAIYQRYIENQEKYGKTVIFAISISHADTLYELFRKDDRLSKKVFLVHSKSQNRVQQFVGFKKSKDGILINVNVMNEGVDIPSIKTVFFTKQMESYIIVTQCIGRALRTCKEEEKKTAYVVNFAVSDIGNKLYLTSPKIAYELYKLDFDEESSGSSYARNVISSELQIFKDLQKMINSLTANVQVSANELLLAGHYNLECEEDSFLLPVTYSEYEKIANCMKHPYINAWLPNKYFFSQRNNVNEMIREAAKAKTYEFISYDDVLMNSFHKLQKSIDELHLKYFRMQYNYTFFELNKKIEELFEEVKNDESLWEYFKQLNVTTKKKFILILWNQFVDLKEDCTIVSYEHIYWGSNFSNEDWIDINEVNSLKQYLKVEKWLKSYSAGLTASYSHRVMGELRGNLMAGTLGYNSSIGDFFWSKVLGEYIKEVYKPIIEKIVPSLKCCINPEVRKLIEDGLNKVIDQIISRIGVHIDDDRADIGRILYSQLVEGYPPAGKCDQWLNACYDFSSINQDGKNQIQSIVDDIFTEEVITNRCYEYNSKILAKKVREYCTDDKGIAFRDCVIQGYYQSLDSESNRKERRRIFEKKLNKHLFMGS